MKSITFNSIVSGVHVFVYAKVIGKYYRFAFKSLTSGNGETLISNWTRIPNDVKIISLPESEMITVSF